MEEKAERGGQSKFGGKEAKYINEEKKRRNRRTNLLSSSMLKKTYSPLATMLSSSAASMISLILRGPAHRTTTGIFRTENERKGPGQAEESEKRKI